MTAPLKAGDLVIAVAEDDCPLHASQPDCDHDDMLGQRYLITSTQRFPNPDCAGLITLAGAGPGWCSGCFRKIEPPYIGTSQIDAEILSDHDRVPV